MTEQDELIQCVFVSKDKKRELGFIYKKDILEDGTCDIYVYEQKDTEGRKRLKYTSCKDEYNKALEEYNNEKSSSSS